MNNSPSNKYAVNRAIVAEIDSIVENKSALAFAGTERDFLLLMQYREMVRQENMRMH